MFVKSYTSLPIEFEVVRSALLSCARDWLEPVAADTERHGERLLSEVGLQGSSRLQRSARLELGEAVLSTERTTSLALGIHVEDSARMLPSLEGTLDAAWLGSGLSYLALSVGYESGSGPLGHIVDRVLLHRVMEATALYFVEAAARRLAARGR